MTRRPSKEQFDEIEFENQLYKNRIQELEDMLSQFGTQARVGKPQQG